MLSSAAFGNDPDMSQASAPFVVLPYTADSQPAAACRICISFIDIAVDKWKIIRYNDSVNPLGLYAAKCKEVN